VRKSRGKIRVSPLEIGDKSRRVVKKDVPRSSADVVGGNKKGEGGTGLSGRHVSAGMYKRNII